MVPAKCTIRKSCNLSQPNKALRERLSNARKLTLLAATTLAKPDIADYHFTTLMPNLGRLDGDPILGAGKCSSGEVISDLISCLTCHLQGLGRNFLRHLRRTRLLVHVVDAASENPVGDYRTVREELRMYNREYLERPCIVVLNKVDIPEARIGFNLLIQAILRIGRDETPSPSDTSSGHAVEALPGEDDHANVFSSGFPMQIGILKKLRIVYCHLLLWVPACYPS
ncbi:probable GTP-binding protein OBGC2 [Actinidia eriantha]|uniref:probable GTP-binding protein OBGC2 n=1 Tax=Actinidia eriantha TaxID=165200 RepID=UPI002586B562|nr:probable GTP-binding protein OBGC2 [Actinidia eriantha]